MTLLALALLSALADPIPVVISTDCGCEMDDQWAISLLALSPSIDVRAVVSAHAPGLTSEASAKVARDVFDHLPIAKKPPVIAGSGKKLEGPTAPWKGPGPERLLAESKEFDRDHRLTVVMIGPATDVASALLIDPSFADRVRIVSMAFDEWPRGGDPFNVHNDPVAWGVVLDSNVPLVVVDGAVTIRNLTLSRDAARTRFGGLGPAADYLLKVHAKWLDRFAASARRVTGSPDAWPVWDIGTAAVLLGFATVEERPRPRLRDDLTFDHSKPHGTIGWVTSIDGDRLWADFATKLRKP